MSRNILVRDLSEEDLAWIDRNTPVGYSRNEFIKSLISKQRTTELVKHSKNTKNRKQKNGGTLPPTFIDLFAGIGGFRIGMTAAGFDCIFTNEWDRYAQRTYAAWYGDEHLFGDDVRNDSLIESIPHHDILCGGFPCQPFSLAGVSKKKSLGRKHGFDDEKQGNLFFAITKIIDQRRPAVVFLENVKNLKSHDGGNTWKVIRSELTNRDYAVFDKIIDAKAWVPQHRERIFIVCFDQQVFGEQSKINFKFPESPEKAAPILGDVLEPRPEKKYMLSDKLWEYLKSYREKHEKAGNGFGYSVFEPHQTTRTLSARYHKDGSEILIKQKGWRNPRRLTPNEAKLLMGFTDKFALQFGHKEGFPISVSDTQAYRQFGNAVVPLVVEAIGAEIMRVIKANRNGR